MLSIALLFASNLSFHVHSLEHGPVQHHDHGSTIAEVEHDHVATKHLSIDTSHADHHEAVMLEIDANEGSPVRQLSNNSSTTDLYALLLLLSLLVAVYPRFVPSFGRTVQRPPDRRFYLSPPLRAPPA